MTVDLNKLADKARTPGFGFISEGYGYLEASNYPIISIYVHTDSSQPGGYYLIITIREVTSRNTETIDRHLQAIQNALKLKAEFDKMNKGN